MIEVELHQLELRYAGLRLGTTGRQARLAASLMEHGQQTPVLVVSEAERYVLIDGYARVEALRSLGRDLVTATLLELPEAEALVLSYRLERGRRRSVLEEAWLIAELVERHGKSQRELALRALSPARCSVRHAGPPAVNYGTAPCVAGSVLKNQPNLFGM